MPNIIEGRVSRRNVIAAGLAALLSPALHVQAQALKDAAGFEATVKSPHRIVSIGNAVTEIVFALGFKSKVVAVDTTSKGVPGAELLPDIGYMRTLAAEGILAQQPDLIMATLDSGPKEAIESLRLSKVPLVQFPIEASVAGIIAKIELAGKLLGAESEAARLSAETAAKYESLQKRVASAPSKPKVLFVLSLVNGKITAGGAGTSAAAMLDMVGVENVAASIHGYQPISAEVLVASPPDAIIMMGNGPTAGLAEKVAQDPILTTTPAAKSKAIHIVDGAALLGFGLRTLDSARNLAAVLHG